MLFSKAREMDGLTFSFDGSMIGNGGLLLNGAACSLQRQEKAIPKDMTDEELIRLGDEEMLLSESAEAEANTLYLSEDELIAYPLAEGEPLIFTAAE